MFGAHPNVAMVLGYDGPVEWGAARPDGSPQKLLNTTRLTQLGWQQ